MHIKQYHIRYNINRRSRGLATHSLKRFAEFASGFGGEEGAEARRWLRAKRCGNLTNA